MYSALPESDCFQKLLDMGGCARTLDPEVSWRVKEIVETPPVDRSSEDVRQLAQAMQRLPLFEALSPLHQLYCAKVTFVAWVWSKHSVIFTLGHK